MPPDISKEHAVETYKSLISISVEGMKLLALLNGGAAVAILAYLGNALGKTTPIPDMRGAMAGYLSGLFLCGVAFFASYMTQLRLYEASVHGRPLRDYERWMRTAIIVCLLSLAAFVAGSAWAVWRFTIPASN